MMNSAQMNMLAAEKSPYLLQHAHNPVHWQPWGDQAFEEAKRRDVPVFLSIGYSSCHWCHVMERESFEDQDVAALLNEGFVSIKVDREERPDVDHLYMEACVAMTGSGGWPLTCLLDHDRRPFFAGTYFPKQSRAGMPGLMELLDRLEHLWKTDRKRIITAAESVTAWLNSTKAASGKPVADVTASAYTQLEASFDGRYGGFGSAPKFPSVHNLLFLLRYGLLHPESKAHEMVKKTLECMAAGGIFDHIGGGFCRYSTDRQWLVPHFEKMLYDNAMLLMVYAETAVAAGEEKFGDVTRRIVSYCLREMLGSHGGFYTAQDADSEGVEGKVYLWTPAEIEDILGPEDGKRFCQLLNITEEGNFEHASIPNHIGRTLTDADRAFASGCYGRLLEKRLTRVMPFKDDKVLASSNSLMIAALALAGRLLRELEWVSQAEHTARFLLDNLAPGGRLMASWREGSASAPATSDDYAYLLWALIELHQATHKPEWLRHAVSWADSMLSLFWDEHDGGLFLPGSDVKGLLVRQKSMHDGALPSGNSVAALNLLRLSRLTGKPEYEDQSSKIQEALAGAASEYPAGSTGLLCASLYQQNLGTEVVIANGEGLEELLKETERYLPFTVISVRGAGYEEMDSLAPFAVAMEAKNGKANAFVCSKGACQQPVDEPGKLAAKLETVY